MRIAPLLVCAALVLLVCRHAAAVTPLPAELEKAREWAARHPAHDIGALPFSFVYDGKPHTDVLPMWQVESSEQPENGVGTRRTITWTDPASGIQLRCESLAYSDYPTLEWTLYFQNTGSEPSPIIENIQSLDTRFDRAADCEFLLHHWDGSQANPSDYAPRQTALGTGADIRFGGAGGRPTNTHFSYFNLEFGNQGVIMSVGWPGQWAATFTRDDAQGLSVRAGQELTHFRLMPGEEVRSPLMVLQFYEGDWLRAQNVWRRWMQAHSMPRPDGRPPKPMMLASSSRAYEEMIKADDQKQIMFIDRYLEEKLPLDYWWMDAGWYIQENGWPQVGTWEIDPARFPNGFKPISEHAHANGVKILVWFEPERVAPGTWLTSNHPDWILGGAGGGLLNLGNPEAWNWLTDHVDTLLTEQGIDLYRQDFNMDPLNHWRGNDPEDRQGITENFHVQGYLAYWDELLRRHPGMLIDSCASGGRRNDIETMRRAVPLWRTDHAYILISTQCMTYGISFWLPFSGTGQVACVDAPYYGGGYTPVVPYAFWSTATPSMACGFDMRVPELDYEQLRTLFAQWQQLSECYYGDYWPLTPYSQASSVWMAWQFDVPEEGRGAIQAFRRKDCVYESGRFPLRGLDPDATYAVREVNETETRVFPGRELLESGLPITIPDKPGAVVYLYSQAE